MRNGKLPEIGFCVLSIGKTDFVRPDATAVFSAARVLCVFGAPVTRRSSNLALF